MTTRKHPHESPEHDPAQHRRAGAAGDPVSPIEARLEARVASQQEAKIGELEASAAEARDRYLRLAADFENYKRRTRQEQMDTIQHATSELMGRLLPVLDDLHNALDHRPEGVDENWVKGLELGIRKLEEAMAAHGLERIDSVGTAFDPKFHEAIGHEETAEHPEDTVVSELRRGYRIRDRVVRPSLVKVSRRPELPSADSAPRHNR
jgi:molecular chaperone GrpE